MRVRLLFSSRNMALAAAAAAGLSLSGCGGGAPDPPAVSIEKPAAEASSQAAPVARTEPQGVAAPTSDAPLGNPASDIQPQPPVQSQFQPRENAPASGQGEMRVAQAGQQPPQAEEVAPQLPPPMSATELAAQLDLDNIPDGSPAELIKYMNDLTAVPFPGNASQDELRNFATKVYSNVLDASDRVLADGSATSEQRRNAVQFKFNAYEMLRQIQPDQADAIAQERLAFAQNIAQSNDPEVSRFARLFLFEEMLGQFASGEESLFQPVLEDAQFIIEDPNADVMHFGVAENAATVFARMGHTDQAVSILQMMKKSFTGSADQRVATRAAQLDDMILQYKIVGSMMAAANGDEAAGEALVANIRAWVETKPTESLEPLQMISTIEMQMEDYGKPALARQLAGLMLEYYGKHPDPQVVKSVGISVSNAEKRIGLLGQPFMVEGNLLNGTPFNWEQYRGKYVLVDFWATWCPICLEEMEHLKQVYEKYRSRGFEVVGINLDDDARARQAFFSQQALPWPTVVSADADNTGFKDPNAQRCGVEALPFLVFVGPDGTVVEINPRGERLEELLESVLNQGSGGVQTLSGSQPASQGRAATADGEINVRMVR